MFLRTMWLAVCLCGLAFSQGKYVFRHEFNLSGAAGVWTIQQPASGGLRVNFKYVTISTSAPLTITFERACSTPATATTAPITRINPEFTSVNAKATAWSGSNAAGCTVMYGPIVVPSGTGFMIATPDDYLTGSGTDKGMTIRSASTTATGSINWNFEEVK